jgi:hypothetical protein
MKVRNLFSLALLIIVFAAQPVQAGFIYSSNSTAGLDIDVNNSASDVTDVNPGDGVCETGSGNGICTLRAAIMEANSTPGLDKITLLAATYTLTRVGYDDTGVDGDLDITDDLEIRGVSSDDTIIDGNASATHGRVFHVHTGTQVLMTDLRIRNGTGEESTVEDSGAGIYNQGDLTLLSVSLRENSSFLTSAIRNAGALRVLYSFITNNTSSNAPAGISNYGTAEIINSLISQNNSWEAGAGIVNSSAMTITNSTIMSNTTNYNAGGIWNYSGNLLIRNSTISNNSTANGDGGGIYFQSGALTLINSTIRDNSSAYNGGGIYMSPGTAGDISLFNVTLDSNRADSDNNNFGDGGGVFRSTGTGILTIGNSILADNVLEDGVVDTPDDCSGTLNSLGYNLVETTTGCSIVGIATGNVTGQDPILGGLMNNGGPTLTQALNPGSPAIDTGNPAGCLDPIGAKLPFDQRGYLRHFDGGLGVARCDMGAVEYLAPDAFHSFLALIIQ